LLELYRLVVVVCVFVKVRENECFPMFRWMPKPISGSETLRNPVTVNPGPRTGSTEPSINPVRGVNSNNAKRFGVMRTLVPKP